MPTAFGRHLLTTSFGQQLAVPSRLLAAAAPLAMLAVGAMLPSVRRGTARLGRRAGNRLGLRWTAPPSTSTPQPLNARSLPAAGLIDLVAQLFPGIDSLSPDQQFMVRLAILLAAVLNVPFQSTTQLATWTVQQMVQLWQAQAQAQPADAVGEQIEDDKAALQATLAEVQAALADARQQNAKLEADNAALEAALTEARQHDKTV